MSLIPAFKVAVLVLIFIPLIRGVARWTALGAGIVSIIGVIYGLFVLTIVPPAAVFAPAVAVVFAALFAFFAFRTYLEKSPT